MQMEEEKALKQLRRTLVPHARPVPNFANPFLPQKYETTHIYQLKKKQYLSYVCLNFWLLISNIYIFITGHVK